MNEEEKQRLEREEFEEDSFVSKLERILLVVDPSANGRLASALSGHLAGLRNMPVTVLELKPEEQHSGPDQKAAEQVKVSSEEAIAKAQEIDETRDDTIHVETRTEPPDLGTSISSELDKGHDLLFLGIEPLAAPAGGYDRRAKTALDAFRKSSVLVSARGVLNRKSDAPLRILVPVTGDNRSMRAIEFASLLAKASGVDVTAIYVQAGEDAGERPRASMDAIFEHVREIGKHYEVDIHTVTGGSGNRELSILTQARRGRYNLVVLGVGRRAGGDLSFGSLADNLLETSDRSLAFFVTG
jgi:nucleotide-binding universal stress UspA family protein